MQRTIHLLAVSVGRPQVIGHWHGKEVVSAIGKKRVQSPTIELDPLGLEGDQVSDHRHHGGERQAVYAYPIEHIPAWERELGRGLDSGVFGQNLTVAGITEDEVHAGDTWIWGEARLQVTLPRLPCGTLKAHMQDDSIASRMRENGRCGWYLQVLTPGVVPTTGTIEVIHAPFEQTIEEIFAAKVRRKLT